MPKKLCTQGAQYGLIKEYTLNHIMDPEYDLGYIPSLNHIGLPGYVQDTERVSASAVSGTLWPTAPQALQTLKPSLTSLALVGGLAVSKGESVGHDFWLFL